MSKWVDNTSLRWYVKCHACVKIKHINVYMPLKLENWWINCYGLKTCLKLLMLNINDNINNGPPIATQEKQIRIRIRRNSVAAVRHFLFH